MAKGSAMGLWKGKKGSSVFYQIKNSNSLQKQGVRERNYEPANPRTTRQAGQRMRMYPAQAVYGVLKDTIERSWQGVKYGQMTRQAYLKSALRSEFFPAVTKGDGVVVPGPYQIAKGTLNEIYTTLSEDGEANFSLVMTEEPETDSIASWSSVLLQDNPSLKEGDQITFVMCYTSNSSNVQFNWAVVSFYLSLTDQTTVSSLFNGYGLNLTKNEEGEDLNLSALGNEYIYAAACIVSREGTTPLRSNATLAVNAAALPDYYDVQSRARARRSYMNPLTVQTTDWPVDPGDQGGGSEGDYYNVTVNQVTTQAGGTEDPTPGGTVSGGGQYLVGEIVTLTATADAQHTFTGWYPSKADALANTNRLSTAGVLMFTAGDLYTNVTTFFGKFMPQL